VAVAAMALGLATLALVPHQIAGETLAAIADMQSPAFFPVFAGGLLTLCGSMLVARTMLVAGAYEPEAMAFPNIGFVLAIGAIILLFAVGCLLIGMVPSAAVVIIGMGYLWGYRDLRILVPVGIMVSVGIYLLFEKTLLIILPRGMVPW
jgi:hypothetical protein